MLQFEIVQGSLKVTNEISTILLVAKKDVAINALSLQEAVPTAELYNIQLGFNAVIFRHPLSDCSDNLGNPFTVNSFIAFAENNFGFSISEGGLTLAEVIAATYFTNDYLPADWIDNNLTVVHNLGTLCPNVSTYDEIIVAVFGLTIVDENTFTLTKNSNNPAPWVTKIGVSK